MKKTNTILFSMLVIVLMISALSVTAVAKLPGVEKKALATEQGFTSIQIKDAYSSACASVYVPGGEVITLLDERAGLSTFAETSDENDFGRASSVNSAYGHLEKQTRTINLNHFSNDYARKYTIIEDIAGSMGTTHTSFDFVPRGSRRIRLDITIRYDVRIFSNRDSSIAQSFASCSYWDDFSDNNAFSVESRLNNSRRGWIKDHDTVHKTVYVPAGTSCGISIGTVAAADASELKVSAGARIDVIISAQSVPLTAEAFQI